MTIKEALQEVLTNPSFSKALEILDEDDIIGFYCEMQKANKFEDYDIRCGVFCKILEIIGKGDYVKHVRSTTIYTTLRPDKYSYESLEYNLVTRKSSFRDFNHSSSDIYPCCAFKEDLETLKKNYGVEYGEPFTPGDWYLLRVTDDGLYIRVIF